MSSTVNSKFSEIFLNETFMQSRCKMFWNRLWQNLFICAFLSSIFFSISSGLSPGSLVLTYGSILASPSLVNLFRPSKMISQASSPYFGFVTSDRSGVLATLAAFSSKVSNSPK